jgi:hypothetical protein
MADQTNPIRQRYDFCAPWVRAAIRTDDNVYPLWMPFTDSSSYGSAEIKPQKLNGYSGNDGKVPESENISSLAFLTQATIDLELSAIPKISVSLTPPFLDARKFIDSSIMDWSRSSLEVQLGYVGSKDGTILSPVFVGRLMKPDVSFGTDITIGLTAQGTGGYFMAATGATRKNDKGLIPRIQNIKDLAQSVGVQVDTKTWRLNSKSQQQLDASVEYAYANMNVLDAIYMMARECGCYIQVIGNSLQLLSYDQVLLGPVIATLQLYDYNGSLGPQDGVYPILSVSSDSGGIFLDARTKKMTHDKIAKDKLLNAGKTPDPPKTPATGPKGKTQQTPKDAPPSETVAAEAAPKDDVTTPDEAVQAAATAAVTDEGSVGIVLDIETLGFPDLIPGMKINVSGVSKRIDGHFMVQTVKHSISASGFTTSMTVRSNLASLTNSLNKTYNSSISDTSTAPSSPSTPAPALDNGSSGGTVPRFAKGVR